MESKLSLWPGDDEHLHVSLTRMPSWPLETRRTIPDGQTEDTVRDSVWSVGEWMIYLSLVIIFNAEQYSSESFRFTRLRKCHPEEIRKKHLGEETHRRRRRNSQILQKKMYETRQCVILMLASRSVVDSRIKLRRAAK